MRFGSICSGIEAASEAWNPLGWKAQWFSEIEPFPSAVLAHRHPDVPNLGDMTKIYDKDVFRSSDLDLICGGTPCQAFSIAGLRKGLADARGNLSLEFCNIVHTKRPRWVVWENVPGVLSSKDNAFGCFLAGLTGADTPLTPDTGDGKWTSAGVVSAAKADGYGIAWRILDAQYFGVPQRRRRVWVVGYLGDWRPAVEVLFERKSVSGDITEGRKAEKGASGCFEVSPNGGRETDISPTLDTWCKDGARRNQGGLCINSMVAFGEYSQDGTFSTVKTRDYKDATDLIVFDATQITSPQNGSNPQPGDPCHTLAKGASAPVIAPCVVTPPVVSNGDAHSGFRDEAGLVWDMRGNGDGKTCPTVTGDHAGRPTDYTPVALEASAVRRLTPDECAKLQGFKPGHARIPWRGKPAEECPDGPQYKGYGNSWATVCAEWLGRRIQKVDEMLRSGL